MIRHLFRLVWNRKGSNALIALELFFSFLVLFLIATAAVYFGSNLGRPLGFDYHGVWLLKVDMKQPNNDSWTPEMVRRSADLMRELRSISQIESVAGAEDTPFAFDSASTMERDMNGHHVTLRSTEVTDDFATVLKMKVVRGRWFSAADDGSPYTPIVLNREAARQIFETEDVIGKTLERGALPGRKVRDWRVVGLVDDYRNDGDFSATVPFMMQRKRVDVAEDRPAPTFLIRTRLGTSAALQGSIISRLRGVAPGWSFEFKTLDEVRQSNLRLKMVLLTVGALIAFFMMVMVGLGLLGVLWQSVARRSSELGLRRALGATALGIQRQVIGETMALATFGIALALALILQLPMLGITGLVGRGVFAVGVLVSLLVMYAFVVFCAWYPSRYATQVQPAEALRAE